jgi:L-2-hydroxyglutarate oxidase LhgO
MDPSRFTCVLGQYAGKQPAQKRLYLQALPFYIEEREEKKKEMEEIRLESQGNTIFSSA